VEAVGLFNSRFLLLPLVVELDVVRVRVREVGRLGTARKREGTREEGAQLVFVGRKFRPRRLVMHARPAAGQIVAPETVFLGLARVRFCVHLAPRGVVLFLRADVLRQAFLSLLMHAAAALRLLHMWAANEVNTRCGTSRFTIITQAALFAAWRVAVDDGLLDCLPKGLIGWEEVYDGITYQIIVAQPYLGVQHLVDAWGARPTMADLLSGDRRISVKMSDLRSRLPRLRRADDYASFVARVRAEGNVRTPDRTDQV
jgi:hypothetical protein